MKAYFCRHSKQKILAICIGLALLYAVPFFTVPGNAAAYIKIDGIDGEATDSAHKDWIEIQSVQFSAKREISQGTGGMREASRPQLSDIVVTKEIDKSSPKLFTEAVIGVPGKNAVIHLTKEVVPGKEEVYMKYILSDILVSSLSTKGGDILSEAVSVSFPKVEIHYTPFRDGVPQEPVTATYDSSKDGEF